MIQIKPDSKNAPTLLFTAYDKDEILGQITCTERKEEGTIVVTSLTGERFLADGLCRTALDYAARNGMLRCIFQISDEATLSVLEQEGFISKSNHEIQDVEVFLKTHKNCGK